jgi:hypothetical protein
VLAETPPPLALAGGAVILSATAVHSLTRSDREAH